jgi:hypothetical protein
MTHLSDLCLHECLQRSSGLISTFQKSLELQVEFGGRNCPRLKFLSRFYQIGFYCGF